MDQRHQPGKTDSQGQGQSPGDKQPPRIPAQLHPCWLWLWTLSVVCDFGHSVSATVLPSGCGCGQQHGEHGAPGTQGQQGHAEGDS